MKIINSNKIRKRFLDFFRSKGHAEVLSDSLVPAQDASLLFTGAGMNPFKDYFLGLKRDLKRAASCQKCFRTGDVEQVGRTPSHLTFFEMLGNFSFGDYFKKEAIPWAWEFLTRDLKIPADRLAVTVYESDDEAARIWKEKIGLSPDRIVRFGAKDNFWPSNAPVDGPNGPCGPCSEIYFDTQRCTVGKICPTPDDCKPGCSCGRFVEVWNLVFTQFDRQPDGSLAPLPAKNIDTGMGLERLTAVMQDKMSVFETDLFQPLLQEIKNLLGSDPRGSDPSLVYAIADHVRALTFLIGDGVVPSNEGRGYVLRMLLRKAVRAGRVLGLKRPFLYRLVPAVTAKMQEPYPELTDRREAIAQAVLAEEERFHQTLKEKVPLLRQEIQRGLTPRGQTPAGLFAAEAAARFYDTHGLSFEEISEVCQEMKVQPPPRAEFDRALEELQAKSKSASGFSKEIFSKDKLLGLVAHLRQPTEFTGHTALGGQGKILAIIQENRFVEDAKAPAQVGVILDRTPFYGEAGGQVGDTGVLEGPEGKGNVLDTQWVGNILVHWMQLMEGRIRTADPVNGRVDAGRRQAIAQNHTATHLLHAALRRVLGPHVMQAGSLVAPDHLRFDFSHPQAVPRRDLEAVESLIREWVEKNLGVSIAEMPVAEARRAGATALFGEKYGQTVRVVSISDVSRELCGGTHLTAIGEVGLLTIAEEGSVAAGIRRVKALTDQEARTFLNVQAVRLSDEKERSTQRAEEKERESGLQKQKVKEAEQQLSETMEVGRIPMVGSQLPGELGHASLRILVDKLRKREKKIVIFLSDQFGNFVASSSEPGIRADALLKLATDIAGGSGGGRPEMAQGRLKDPARFAEVKKRIIQFIQEHA